MKKNILSIVAIGLFFIAVPNNSVASIITYNFSGELTSVTDPSSLLGDARGFQVGNKFQAIYSIDSDASVTSGTIGGSMMTESSFSNAILNFQFYVGNLNIVNSYYRLQNFRVINGMINGKPADWLEIITDGGKDNYGNFYGNNSYNEYIDSTLNLTDLSGIALDSYNKTFTGNIPLTLNLDLFSFGNIMVTGESSNDLTALKYQLRGNIDSFSSEGFSSVPIPASIWVFSTGLIGLVSIRKQTLKSATLSV